MPLTLHEKRAAALSIFQAGVAAADPHGAVDRALTQKGVAPGATIIAVGKAAMRMAEAALARAADPREIVIVTNPENARDRTGAQVFAAAHPVPDAVGLAAAEAVEAALGRADHVLALLSGGGSALLPAPAKGLTLDDKIEVNRALLASGADITQMNLVRQALSRLKGGGLLRAAAPAPVRALILSDVVGDDLSTIASGPTAPPLGTRAEAAELLVELGLWEKVPDAVRRHLEAPEEARDVQAAENELVGSNTASVMAMARAARDHGMPVHIHTPALTGDVEEAARRVAGTTDPGIHLFGGETTVTLRGKGKGGRNQELALRVALHLGRGDWVYLQGGTDGRDGPTDAAGGLLDAERLAAMQRTVDVLAMLDDNDAYHALKAGDALLMTGATGTNAADLGVLIR
ncbi:MAG: DUF4147 domain-containing protein [Pseudomonadota bacterium]